MKYQEVLASAKGQLGPHCRVCPVCNGYGCRNTVPGPGAKGSGTVAIRNYEAWQKIDVNMDTVGENGPVHTTARLFGQEFSLPVLAGPVGALKLHYGDKHDDLSYNSILLPGAKKAGIAAFTGDGVDPAVFAGAARAIKNNGGMGIPTIKPWDMDTIFEKLALARDSGAFAVAMDIDAAGLPFLQGLTPPAGPKSVEQLAEIAQKAGVPFLLKGIMTVKGAEKALRAGCAGIVVSNHGGRVQDGVPSGAEVLPEIVEAVGKRMTVLVDGGVRTGLDVFRALALGADGVLVARPYVTAVYGAGEEGVVCLTEKLRSELADTMLMCNARSLKDITRDKIRLG